MKFYRIPTKQEEQLIELLVHKSSLEMSEDWKNGLLVRPMDDGEMGSLYLFPQGKINESRKLGRQISEFQFTDAAGITGHGVGFQFTDIDGVEVIASLNVDVDGVLFELDIWKTNFEKLVKLPDL